LQPLQWLLLWLVKVLLWLKLQLLSWLLLLLLRALLWLKLHAAVALAAAAPLEGAAVTEAAAASVLGFVAAVALAAAMDEAAAVGPGSEACLFCLFSQASLLSLLYCCLLALGGRLFVFFGKTVVSLQLKVTSSTPPLDSS
jgi:hypothetical protein